MSSSFNWMGPKSNDKCSSETGKNVDEKAM